MAKQDLTDLTEVEQMKKVSSYIIQRSFHKVQENKIDADDLIKKFKHKKFSNGIKRIKFYNRLLMKTVNEHSSSNPAYQKVKIVIKRI